jgi:hypothetical protein
MNNTFNSNMITKIITALAILPFSFISPAQALVCDTVNGLSMCVQKTGYDRYTVNVQYGNESETMDVQCAGKYVSEWQSYGNLNKAQADKFARYFCSL